MKCHTMVLLSLKEQCKESNSGIGGNAVCKMGLVIFMSIFVAFDGNDGIHVCAVFIEVS